MTDSTSRLSMTCSRGRNVSNAMTSQAASTTPATVTARVPCTSLRHTKKRTVKSAPNTNKNSGRNDASSSPVGINDNNTNADSATRAQRLSSASAMRNSGRRVS